MESATALLIHGSAPAVWGDLPERLVAYDVVADNRRGFDGGPLASDLSQHASDAAERIGPTPAVIVGWSIGGVIALELACRYPERVAALVLLEPPFRAKRRPRPAMVRAIAGATVLGKRGRAQDGAERFLRWALARRDGTSDLGRLDRDALQRAAPAIVAELAFGTGEHLARRAIAALTMPVTIVYGTESDSVFGAAARRLSALIPHARLVAATGSGHAIQLDAPELVAEEVTRALPAPARA